MITRRLLWGMTWRGAVWGTFAGTTLGTLYATLILIALDSGLKNILYALIGGLIFGGIYGLASGIVLGILGGYLSGIITPLFYPSKSKVTPLVGSFCNALFGVTGALVLFTFPLTTGCAFCFGTEPRWNSLVFVVFSAVPATIAACAAVFISKLLARWYEREIQKQPS